MKKESILKQFLVIGSGTFINLLLGLIGTPVITRLVDPSQYGQFSMFTTYSGIFMLVLGLGLDQALVRYFYRIDGLAYRKSLLIRCIGLPIAGCGVLVAVLSGIAILTDRDGADIVQVILFGMNILALLINRFALLTLRLNHESRIYSIVTILNKAAYLVIAVALISTSERTKHYFELIIATVAACSIATGVAVLKQKSLWCGKQRKEIQLPEEISYSKLIPYGFPLMIANGVYMFFQAIDRICLEYFCDYHEVGVYSSAMSLMAVIAVVRTTFTTIWVPSVVEHFEEDPEDRKYFEQGNRFVSFVMLLFGLTLMFSKDLMVLLLGAEYRSAATIMPFLLFQPIMYTVSETTVIGITLKKKTYANIVVALIACITNLVGNIALIPQFGPTGAAISTGISYIVFFAARTHFSNRYLHVDYCLKEFAVMTLVTLMFAWYITFHSFSALTVLMYSLSLILLILLYRKEVQSIISLLRKRIAKN